MALSRNHVYVSTPSDILKFNFQGMLKRKWEVTPRGRGGNYSKQLRFDRSELFQMDFKGLIRVFSPKGILLREMDVVRAPWDMAVSPCGQILYVTEGTKIRVISRVGTLLFTIESPNSLISDLASIVLLQNRLYVSDWDTSAIHVFQLSSKKESKSKCKEIKGGLLRKLVNRFFFKV
jgi:hypothetical protein